MHILHVNGDLHPVSSFSVSQQASHHTTMSGVPVVKGESITVNLTIPSMVQLGADSLPYAILSTDDRRVQMEQFSPSSVTANEHGTEVHAVVGGIQYV